MKALQLVAPRKCEIVKVDDPEPGYGEVVVELIAAAICNQSDAHAFRGDRGSRPCPPGFPGHEGVGRVARVGKGVAHLEVGQPVCMTGMGGPGVYSELVLRRADLVVALGPDCDPVPAACLELYGCVWRSLKMCGSVEGRTLVVNGLGPAGLAAVQLARNITRGPIIGVDPVSSRRDLATDCGADRSVDPTDEKSFGALVSSRPHTVLECTGSAAGISSAMTLAARQVVMFGVCFEPIEINQMEWFHKELTIRNSKQLDMDDFAEAVSMYGHGRLDPTRLVTHHMSFDEYDAALKLLSDRQAVKLLLSWR